MALIETGGYEHLNDRETTDSTDDTSTEEETNYTDDAGQLGSEFDTTGDEADTTETTETGGTTDETTNRDYYDYTSGSTFDGSDDPDSGGDSLDPTQTAWDGTDDSDEMASTSSTSDDSGDSGTSNPGGIDNSELPETVNVGQSYPGIDPPGRWDNPVDSTRLHIEETQPMQGKTATVQMEFTNRMDQSVSIAEPVSINGQEVTTANATLAPGEEMSTTASMPVPKGAGSVTISTGGNSVMRQTKDFLGGQNLNLAPDPPDPGGEATMYITWVNQIDQPADRMLPVKVNGQQVDTHQVSLGPNEMQADKITVSVPDTESDTFDIDVGPASVSTHTSDNSAYETITGTDEDGFTTETDPDQGTWTDDFETAQGASGLPQGQLVDSGDVEDGKVVSDNMAGAAQDEPGASGLPDQGGEGDPRPAESSGGISLGPFEDLFTSSDSAGSGSSRKQMGVAAVLVLAVAYAGGWV